RDKRVHRPSGMDSLAEAIGCQGWRNRDCVQSGNRKGGLHRGSKRPCISTLHFHPFKCLTVDISRLRTSENDEEGTPNEIRGTIFSRSASGGRSRVTRCILSRERWTLDGRERAEIKDVPAKEQRRLQHFDAGSSGIVLHLC